MNRIDKIRTHLSENKTTYIVGGVCLVAGASITAVVLKNASSITVSGSGNNVVGKARTINQVSIALAEKSTPSKPVHLVGTNLYFNSLSEAARETGHSLSSISKNVNGHLASIKGDVFEILEKAA